VLQKLTSGVLQIPLAKYIFGQRFATEVGFLSFSLHHR